jgi:hypothetical protein
MKAGCPGRLTKPLPGYIAPPLGTLQLFLL